MRPGQSIQIRVMDRSTQDAPVPGLLLAITFMLSGRARYSFCLPASDSRGNISITYDYCEQERVENSRIFLMDYDTRLEECDSQFRLTLRSASELTLATRLLPQYRIRDWRKELDLIGRASNQHFLGEEATYPLDGDATNVKYFVVRVA